MGGTFVFPEIATNILWTEEHAKNCNMLCMGGNYSY